jgi:FtsZ-interacting cell division protein ZipA
MTFLIALFARSTLLQPFARQLAWLTTIIAVVALCGLLWTCWLSSHDKAVIEADRNEANMEVLTDAAGDNDRAATGLAEEEKANDERIEKARGAAVGSDDPLAAGFDSLRSKKN